MHFIPKKIAVTFVGFTFSLTLLSQQSHPKIITMDAAVSIALANHPTARNAELKLQANSTSVFSGLELGNTEVNFIRGPLYSNTNDNFLEFRQHLGSPISHIQKYRYNKQLEKTNEAEQKIIIKQLTAEVKKAYSNYLYHFYLVKILNRIVPLYDQLLDLTGMPYSPADPDTFRKINAEILFASFQNKHFQAEQELKVALYQLQLWLNDNESYVPADTALELYAIQIKNSGPDKFAPAAYLSFYNEKVTLTERQISQERARLYPELVGGFFNHQLNGMKGYQGFMVGISTPLWYFPQKAKIKEARINKDIMQNNADYQKLLVTKKIENLKIQLDQNFVNVSFYRENALHKADMLIESASKQIQLGKIDYIDCLEKLQSAIQIQTEYLGKIKLYNESAIELESYID